ncbi:MAG: tetratricopeptide repeat protein [Saprospiraceae bacterium]|nr:tetratricopeptide repeat protein [Saprospiraceae bacterium]
MRLLLTMFGILLFNSMWAQEAQLAQQYYQDGEYEKAAKLYEKLYADNHGNDFYFDRQVESLLALEEYGKCEEVLKQELKKYPQKVQLYVTYGNLYEQQYQDELANEQYDKAIKKLPADRYTIIKMAQAFTNLTKYDLAIATYERGAELLNDQETFSYNLGELYRRKGDVPLMITNYLHSMSGNSGRMDALQTLFQRYLDEDGYLELQTQLYDRIQQDQENLDYPEMLAWVFIQRKDYRNAFRQVKALDKRLSENGSRVFQLATVAESDRDYDAALTGYEYIVTEKGVTSSFYVDAKRRLLGCKRKKITEGFEYHPEELQDLAAEYVSFLNEFGRSKATARLMIEEAELQAFYLNDLNKAIEVLDMVVNLPGIQPVIQAEAKLRLADFYLMTDEIWESTLLYSQVDKDFSEDILGHEARFRNAKLSYYNGDFEWAQAQFEILKASTSKLIANDALDLSIFIMDNLGLDTTAESLGLYAQADLLIFQNRFEEAFSKLDELLVKFPEHSLYDDVLYSKAHIYRKKREYEMAASYYQQIIDNYGEEIRADNALFELAELYENQLGNPEKAQSLYEILFIDYSGSTFAVEARKRFRRLRGDNI